MIGTREHVEDARERSGEQCEHETLMIAETGA
jgi:hypothetical protein